MGEREFDANFSALYGHRWTALRDALKGPTDAVDYAAGLAAPYRMDSASVTAAKVLRLPEHGEILDACAAPGGKTLVMASRLPPGATILANELSSDRRRRLSDVLDAHLPPELRPRVRVSGFDAAAAGGRPSERGRFRAILLDAPCSSERHVLASQSALDAWTPARVRFLAQRQWALLSSAFLMLAPGGSLVYSTCALSPEENDGPVSRLVKKYGQDVFLDAPEDVEGAERTDYGLLFLPDKAGGSGPMYVCRIGKKETAKGPPALGCRRPPRGLT
ncbi:MAG: 16S rRNA methyltransferase [Spirochaetia bacterium]|nr:16S rRNA methyltransferase [Spirochaetia bacterium]